MVQKNRSKEVWHVPKRGSLHQTICLIESLIDRNYDQTRWNPQKQNNIGNDLRKRGAVRTKRSPSNQSIRTLLASVPQYLGFLYIDSSTTPNTVKLTEMGRKLYNFHKSNLRDIGTLAEGKKNGDLIESSPVFLEQFEKLQITNPIILKDCEDIFVFPFRAVLAILMELEYLDREELAYFVFSIRDETEIPLVVQQIKRYRHQSKVDRNIEINHFKETHIGNITLVQAPSSSYFESLCFNTGIIDKFKIKIPNKGSSESDKLPAIKIKSGQKAYVNEILMNKYKDAEAYDFKDRLRLWIDYIGSADRKIPPRDIELMNTSNGSVIMTVEQNNKMLIGDLVEVNKSLIVPMFLNEDYEVILISPIDGSVLKKINLNPDYSTEQYKFNCAITVGVNETADTIGKSIIDHSKSRTFDSNYSAYLRIVEKIIGSNLINDKNLRGGYYEFLFYKLLDKLSEDGIIDDVYWNGKLGEFGLPRPAPGGKRGTPDIIFTIDDEFFVLEVTTIKAKSTQFSAEGSSVPDHIKIFSEDNINIKVNGIFTAPVVHDRNTAAMKAILNPLNINIKCIKDQDLVTLFLSKDRGYIFNELKSN